MPEAQINRWTLRFKDKEFERTFVREHVKRDLPMCTFYIMLGIGAILTYGILDYLVLPEEQFWILVNIRLWTCGILSVFVAACYLPDIDNKIQWVISASMVVSGGGIILMTCILDEPFSYIYYAGLILTIIYSSNFSLLQFSFGMAVSLILFGLYLYAAVVLNPIPNWALTANLFFLTVSIGWTIWTSYWKDFNVRSEFVSRYFLMREKSKSEELLTAAEAGNKAKSEFLAVMSHELRTPLNAIIGFSEVMQQELLGPMGNDQYEAYITDIADSGHHLLSIINDILDLSKAESGHLELNEDTVEIETLIEKALRVFREKATLEGVHLSYDRLGANPVLLVDSRQLRQIVINLVTNAIKFTEKGGWVRVRTEIDAGGHFNLLVEDNGIGISEQDLPRVLDPFVQVESSLSRENGGTGLGLPLVKKMVELHGGTLALESKLGAGTRAVVQFPAHRVMSHEAEGSSTAISAA